MNMINLLIGCGLLISVVFVFCYSIVLIIDNFLDLSKYHFFKERNSDHFFDGNNNVRVSVGVYNIIVKFRPKKKPNNQLFSNKEWLIFLIKVYQINPDQKIFDIYQWFLCIYSSKELDLILNMINIAGLNLGSTPVEKLIPFFEMDLNQKIDMNQYDNNVQLIL